MYGTYMLRTLPHYYIPFNLRFTSSYPSLTHQFKRYIQVTDYNGSVAPPDCSSNQWNQLYGECFQPLNFNRPISLLYRVSIV